MERSKKRIINVGEIFFADMGDIIFWQKDDYDKECIMYCTQDCGNFSSEVPMLIAIRYIGDGVFEEMLTGENLLVEAHHMEYADSPKITGQSTVVGYVRAKNGKMFKSDIYKNSYKLEIAKEVSKKYPMVLYDGKCFYEVTEETKNIYLSFSDQEKRSVLGKLKREALEKTKEFVNDIEENLKSIDLSDVMDMKTLNIAYLDNQLFDFGYKVK